MSRHAPSVRRVGEVRTHFGGSTRELAAYLTLHPISCGECGHIIPPGATVTRHGFARRLMTGERQHGPGSCELRYVCWHCYPFMLCELSLHARAHPAPPRRALRLSRQLAPPP